MVADRFRRLLKIKFQSTKILGPNFADFLKQFKMAMQKRGWNYFQPGNSGKSRDFLGHMIDKPPRVQWANPAGFLKRRVNHLFLSLDF